MQDRINIPKSWLLGMFCFLSAALAAEERVTLRQLETEGWTQYIGRRVEIADTLYLCGNFYDSLILAPRRLIVPEERALGLAEGDSTMLRQLQRENREGHVCLCCKPQNYRLRTGMMTHGVVAKVTGERKLVAGRVPHFRNSHLTGVSGCNSTAVHPRRPKGTLAICGANVENLFYHLGGYAQPRTKPAQRDRQVKKVAAGLHGLDADLYALCEVQQGDSAPEMLVAALNRKCCGTKYAYVRTDWPCADRIGGCFVYRTDRVEPVGEMRYAYLDTASHYHYRLLLHGFRSKKGGEIFYVSLNHLRSKRGDAWESNQKRVTQTDSLLRMLSENGMQDSLTLLVGDYNCYTQEQPLQRIIRAGYADMLPHTTDSMGEDRMGCYSYVYHSEAGYLDRCFASPRMAERVVKAEPFHINADFYYSHGFKRMKDRSRRRYADHDPIMVYIRP